MDSSTFGKKIIVVKGNDTDWNNSPFLVIHFRSEEVDFSDFKAVFSLCGITKTYNDLSSGYISINFNAQETASLPFGEQFGTLKLVDTQNRIATIESLIPFELVSVVHDDSILTTPFNMEVTVEQGGEHIMNIDFYVGGTPWGSVYGDINEQKDLMDEFAKKQDVIDDLEQIRSGAALGATALQPSALNNTALTGNTTAESLSVNGDAVLTTTSSLDGSNILTGTIEETSLSQDIQTSLGLADSAVQVIETGSENGTISVDGNDVSVKGLGSAAYTDSSAYDAAGSASTAESNAKGYADDVASTAESNAKGYADGLASNYATAAQGLKADSALQPNDNITELNNNAGYITGIDSADVTTALGYTPYDSTNPSGYQANVIESIKVNGTAQTISNKAVDISVPLVVDSVESTSTTSALSANMGKELKDQIDNLSGRGRFLALWNCATGLAETNPPESPYTYHSGDYFIVGTVATGSGTNYRPTGSSYTTGVASTVVETAEVSAEDVYYFDGTNWHLQINSQKTVSFGSIAGSPYDNTNLASALNDKLESTDLKTINGNSIVGSGDIVISQDNQFNSSWTTNSTTATFLSDVYSDTTATVGKLYIGELTCSDLPESMNNAEAVMEVLPSSTAAQKVIHIALTSGTTSPYRWELTYYRIGGTSYNSGWIAFQPKMSAGNGIDITNNVISTGTASESTSGIVQLANTNEAVAGSNNTKALTPETTKQAIASQTHNSLTASQRTTLINDGTYMGDDVGANVVFETDTGKFEKTQMGPVTTLPTPTGMSGLDDSPYSLETDGTNIYAMQMSGNKLYYSSDYGDTWNYVTVPGSGSGNRQIYYGDGYIFIYDRNTLNPIYYSSDLTNWSSISLPQYFTAGCSGVIFTNNKLVVADAPNGSKNIAISSNIGQTWTQKTQSYNIQCLSLQNNMMVAGTTSGRILYSSDGNSWSASSVINNSGATINFVKYINGLYYTCPYSSGYYYYSSSLSGTFTGVNVTNQKDFHSAECANNAFVGLRWEPCGISYSFSDLPPAANTFNTSTVGTGYGRSIMSSGTYIFVSDMHNVYRYDFSGSISLVSLSYTKSEADMAISSAETNAKNYADGLSSNYATASQGTKADSALQPSDISSSVSPSSTNDTAVGAKLFYDTVGTLETALYNINSGS